MNCALMRLHVTKKYSFLVHHTNALMFCVLKMLQYFICLAESRKHTVHFESLSSWGYIVNRIYI